MNKDFNTSSLTLAWFFTTLLSCHYWFHISSEKTLLSSLVLPYSAVISVCTALCVLLILNISVWYLNDVLRMNEQMTEWLIQKSCAVIGNLTFSDSFNEQKIDIFEDKLFILSHPFPLLSRQFLHFLNNNLLQW